MNKFTMLVSLPGAGKSTYAQKIIAENPNTVWVSSDAIREELWGDANDQQQPSSVFGEMFKRAVAALNADKDVVYDATNLVAKTRASTLANIREHVNRPIFAECAVVLCSIKECKRRQNDRDRKVPDEVIDRMVRQFQTPWYNEGWDYITTLNAGPKQDLRKEHNRMAETTHDNPHHTSANLNAHCLGAVAAFNAEITDATPLDGTTTILREAIYQHDVGKRKTKVFHDTKGRPTEIAHYYSHDNMGAYLWLTSNEIDRWNEYDFLLIAALIQWHMQPYFLDQDKTKLDEWCIRKKFGIPFSDWIWTIHQVDKAAH